MEVPLFSRSLFDQTLSFVFATLSLFPFSSSPSSLPPSLSPGEDGQEVLYGTQNGKIGLVKLTPTEPSYRWDMLNERKHGGITSLATTDLTGDGLPDIIVGRDNGVVEVYGFDDSDEPRLKFTHVRHSLVVFLCSVLWGKQCVASNQESLEG